MKTFLFKEETYAIIGACFEVHKHLGNGYLEAVYSEALSIELRAKGFPFEKEKELRIVYKDMLLEKKYIADFVCFSTIIVELKALTALTSQHESQLLNYLKTTGLKVGLLINFGEPSLNYKRLVL
jgi:GxxExxY protein